MIKAITVTTPKGESLKLTLANPEESGLIVKSIEGLGPSKANHGAQHRSYAGDDVCANH